jgi:hypothetical protein
MSPEPAVPIGELPVGILPGSVPDAPTVPPTPAGMPPVTRALNAGARALALDVLRRLQNIEGILRRQLELEEAPIKNFLGAGSVAGAGTLAAAPAAILAANPRRRGLQVQNTGAAGALTIGLGVTGPQPGAGLVLAPGTSWNGTVSRMLWTGSVSLVASQAGVTYSWLEVMGGFGQ